MDTCNCKEYSDILDHPSLKKRFKETKSILSNLKLIAEHQGKEHKLYECKVCGQFWQRTTCWTAGVKHYAYKVPSIKIEEWKGKPYIKPDELFASVGHFQQYISRAIFEEQNVKCKSEGCNNNAIKMSVLCVIHHLQNINIKITLPEDKTWFPPYEKHQFELAFERLCELPNYKKFE